MFQYEPCAFTELASFDAYLASLSSPIESFMEDHFLESACYRIIIDNQDCGSFAVHEEKLLTHFYLVTEVRRYSQHIFREIIRSFKIETAFVPTCDEFFLSHALDTTAETKRQAYFFVDGGDPDSPKLESAMEYRRAVAFDTRVIETVSASFVDNLPGRIQNGQVHVGHLNGEMVAVGMVLRNVLLAQHASIGMFTHESYRRMGIGTCTVLHLKRFCRKRDLVPLAGCGCENTGSKSTLEAAGMVLATRLLRFEFRSEE